QVAIRGTEVVPPLADAVRFVDRDEREVDAAQRGADTRLDAFGRRVDELVLALAQTLDARAPLFRLDRRIEERRAHADLAQRGGPPAAMRSPSDARALPAFFTVSEMRRSAASVEAAKSSGRAR